MAYTIKELDVWCKINNFSIKFDKKHQLCGLKKYDYKIKM